MTLFQYIARSANGEEVAGVMQADSPAAVARTLDERKLFPVSVSEQAAEGSRLVGGRIRLRDLSVVYGQLADLLEAGVPLLRALDTLRRAVTNRRLGGLVGKVHDDVSAGKTLAEALAAQGEVFSPLHVAMVRAGERAGFLEQVLSNLGDFLDRQDELRSKIRGAMVYPAMLTVFGAAILTGILMILVPKFQPYFAGVPLPLPTRVLFAASDLLRGYHWLVLALLVAAALAVRARLNSPAGRLAWDNLRLRLPVIGRAMRVLSITRFCRILGTMLANGVPILQALAISKDATGSRVLAGHIERAAESVRAGEALAAPLKQSGLFPAEVIEMIAIAEESNQLEKVLVQVADKVDRRFGRQVDAAVRLIEPLILAVIAGLIGFAAVGLVWPIFLMSQTLR
jgi:general secretion pathway protein F/type IV pilus assembly protein PilC